MKITTTENGEIQLEEVYNPIVLKTRDGEVMAITMRDTGFELDYQGKWYFAKQGVIEPFDMNVAKYEDKPVVVGRSEQFKCLCCDGTGIVEGESYDDKQSCLTCSGRGHFN